MEWILINRCNTVDWRIVSVGGSSALRCWESFFDNCNGKVTFIVPPQKICCEINNFLHNEAQ